VSRLFMRTVGASGIFASRRLSVILIALILALGNQTAFSDNEKATREQLEQLSKEMKELNRLLKQFKGHRSELQSSLEKSEVDIGKIKNKVRTIQKKLNKQQKDLGALQQQRSKLQSAKRQQQKHIEKHILAAYQMGQQKKIKILLNQENPDKVSRALTYYDYFNQARSEQIESYVNVISELNILEPKISKKTRALSQAKSTLSKEHKNLIAGKKERQNSLSKINSAIKSKDQRLRQINKDRQHLEELLSAVEQTLANITIPGDYRPFTALKGKLPWPVNGKPRNRFGKKRSDSKIRWQGLAIKAKEGADVKAIHHGRIVFADWFRGSGLLVIIDHGDGYMSLYAHNQSLLKETGEWVVAGESISTVGNSGGQNQAGLYFEIRHNGKPTDPRRWCRKV
jgi:murein hydrolase activator